MSSKPSSRVVACDSSSSVVRRSGHVLGLSPTCSHVMSQIEGFDPGAVLSAHEEEDGVLLRSQNGREAGRCVDPDLVQSFARGDLASIVAVPTARPRDGVGAVVVIRQQLSQ